MQPVLVKDVMPSHYVQTQHSAESFRGSSEFKVQASEIYLKDLVAFISGNCMTGALNNINSCAGCTCLSYSSAHMETAPVGWRNLPWYRGFFDVSRGYNQNTGKLKIVDYRTKRRNTDDVRQLTMIFLAAASEQCKLAIERCY